MSLEKAMTQKHLTKDTIDAQFCSDWLKKEMHRLFDQNAEMLAALKKLSSPPNAYKDGYREVKALISRIEAK